MNSQYESSSFDDSGDMNEKYESFDLLLVTLRQVPSTCQGLKKPVLCGRLSVSSIVDGIQIKRSECSQVD